jgi:hypothetical protein
LRNLTPNHKRPAEADLFKSAHSGKSGQPGGKAEKRDGQLSLSLRGVPGLYQGIGFSRAEKRTRIIGLLAPACSVGFKTAIEGRDHGQRESLLRLSLFSHD